MGSKGEIQKKNKKQEFSPCTKIWHYSANKRFF